MDLSLSRASMDVARMKAKSVLEQQRIAAMYSGDFYRQILPVMYDASIIDQERFLALMAVRDIQTALSTRELIELAISWGITPTASEFWKRHKSREELIRALQQKKADMEMQAKLAEQQLVTSPSDAERAARKAERSLGSAGRRRRNSLVVLGELYTGKDILGDIFGSKGEYTDGIIYMARRIRMDSDGAVEVAARKKAATQIAIAARAKARARRNSVTGPEERKVVEEALEDDEYLDMHVLGAGGAGGAAGGAGGPGEDGSGSPTAGGAGGSGSPVPGSPTRAASRASFSAGPGGMSGAGDGFSLGAPAAGAGAAAGGGRGSPTNLRKGSSNAIEGDAAAAAAAGGAAGGAAAGGAGGESRSRAGTRTAAAGGLLAIAEGGEGEGEGDDGAGGGGGGAGEGVDGGGSVGSMNFGALAGGNSLASGGSMTESDAEGHGQLGGQGSTSSTGSGTGRSGMPVLGPDGGVRVKERDGRMHRIGSLRFPPGHPNHMPGHHDDGEMGLHIHAEGSSGSAEGDDGHGEGGDGRVSPMQQAQRMMGLRTQTMAFPGAASGAAPHLHAAAAAAAAGAGGSSARAHHSGGVHSDRSHSSVVPDVHAFVMKHSGGLEEVEDAAAVAAAMAGMHLGRTGGSASPGSAYGVTSLASSNSPPGASAGAAPGFSVPHLRAGMMSPGSGSSGGGGLDTTATGAAFGEDSGSGSGLPARLSKLDLYYRPVRDGERMVVVIPGGGTGTAGMAGAAGAGSPGRFAQGHGDALDSLVGGGGGRPGSSGRMGRTTSTSGGAAGGLGGMHSPMVAPGTANGARRGSGFGTAGAGGIKSPASSPMGAGRTYVSMSPAVSPDGHMALEPLALRHRLGGRAGKLARALSDRLRSELPTADLHLASPGGAPSPTAGGGLGATGGFGMGGGMDGMMSGGMGGMGMTGHVMSGHTGAGRPMTPGRGGGGGGGDEMGMGMGDSRPSSRGVTAGVGMGGHGHMPHGGAFSAAGPGAAPLGTIDAAALAQGASPLTRVLGQYVDLAAKPRTPGGAPAAPGQRDVQFDAIARQVERIRNEAVKAHAGEQLVAAYAGPAGAAGGAAASPKRSGGGSPTRAAPGRR